MGEILPDGSIQGYFRSCPKCGKDMEVNMQGDSLGHKCKKDENLPIYNVIGSCCEIASKKRGFIYVDEECGNKAKIEIEYTLNNRVVRKQLCLKHFNSVTAWLDRIKVSYNCL